jgi:hypothetical protein
MPATGSQFAPPSRPGRAGRLHVRRQRRCAIEDEGGAIPPLPDGARIEDRWLDPEVFHG